MSSAGNEPRLNPTGVPPALLAAIAGDLRPVRPLASPSRRALALLPLGIVLLLGMPAFWVWYANIRVLVPVSWWFFSPLETVVGLLLLAAAFREAVPGRELPAGALTALLACALVGFLAINLASALVVPGGVRPDTAALWLRECIGRTVAFSIPALAIPAWLVARALPNRPALTGALCGLGIGLMADAGLRAMCWDGEHAHVVLAHGGSIAVLVALGAVSATLVERVKRHRRRELRR